MNEMEKIEEAIRVAQSSTKIIEENLREVIKTIKKDKRLPGWKCPKCGSDQTSVVDSRIRDNFRYRRKACLDCGHTFSTAEIVIGEE